MRSLLSSSHSLTRNQWVLSFVRRFDQDHCFLILESEGDAGKRIIKRAHLVWSLLDKDPSKANRTRCAFLYEDISEGALSKVAQNCSCRSFAINNDEKKDFDQEVSRYQAMRDVPYAITGKTKTAGMFGASLDVFGSRESKQECIEKKEVAVKEGGGLSTQSSLALLREGHNCVSWAEEMVRYVLRNREEKLDPRSFMAKYLIAVPQTEAPSIESSCTML